MNKNKNYINKNYWESYYSKKKSPQKRSSFALFCKKHVRNYKGTIIDLGCGNGRDTFYFNKLNLKCIGIDKSKVIISKNKKKKKSDFILFKRKNFLKCNFDKMVNNKFSIYSRFILHAIDENTEKKLFKNILSSKKLEYLFIEARSINDKLYGIGKKVGNHAYITTHYRRFIDPKKLKSKLSMFFNIKYFNEAVGYSKLKHDNPSLIRVIAKRK